MIRKRGEILQEDINRLSKETKTHPMWVEALMSRGVTTQKEMYDFFHGVDYYLPNFSQAKETAEAILNWIREGKRFLIYGDYDVDGVTSTTIMMKTLKLLRANVQFFIPSRFNEGYGVSQEVMEAKIHEFDVLLTVDTGITAVEQIQYVKSKGKHVIITDHHMIPETKPEADYYVHPFLDERMYKVCGAFTALQLAKELLGHVPFYLEFLACLGTVADQMPLLGVNRNLVRQTLVKLSMERPFPTNILFAEIDYMNITDWQFKIIPMLNAAGRMDTANYAVHFLMSVTNSEAQHYYGLLKGINTERKNISDKIKTRAIEYVNEHELYNDPVMIIPLEDSHEGVNGIVSSAVLTKFGKPTIILYKHGTHWVGSGRSKTLNLHHTLNQFSEYFDRFGGHDFAVGLKIADENLHPFIEALRGSTFEDTEAHREYDVQMPVHDLQVKMAGIQKRFEPFGQANPEITLRSLIRVDRVQLLKEGKYFKLSTTMNPEVNFMFWERYEEQIQVGDYIDVLYSIEENNFRGRTTVSAHVSYFEKVEINDA